METHRDPHQVVKALESTLAFNPDNVEVMIRLVRLYEALGMPVRATVLSERARHLAPHHVYFRKNAARVSVAPRSEGFSGQMKALVQRFFFRG